MCCVAGFFVTQALNYRCCLRSTSLQRLCAAASARTQSPSKSYTLNIKGFLSVFHSSISLTSSSIYPSSPSFSTPSSLPSRLSWLILLLSKFFMAELTPKVELLLMKRGQSAIGSGAELWLNFLSLRCSCVWTPFGHISVGVPLGDAPGFPCRRICGQQSAVCVELMCFITGLELDI